jgi:HAE1 family hydrophobic/amphiphilic exporter-1
VVEAGPIRLRPVLMTTAAMIFGMMPVAFGRGDGAEWRNPMGVIAIGGLLTSTLLTLVVVPVVYTLLDDAQTSAARLLGRAARSRPAKPEGSVRPLPDLSRAAGSSSQGGDEGRVDFPPREREARRGR